MSTTLSLVSEMERIASALGTERGGESQVSLSSVAEKIARNLGVRNEEVGIMAVSNRWQHLHFLVPEALKKVGFIPLSSNSALAARTARDGVIQISRKGATAANAGPDFTVEDLGKILALCKPLGKLLQHIAGE